MWPDHVGWIEWTPSDRDLDLKGGDIYLCCEGPAFEF